VCVWYTAGSGVLQGALCGLASYFPSRYMQAEMTGQVSSTVMQDDPKNILMQPLKTRKPS